MSFLVWAVNRSGNPYEFLLLATGERGRIEIVDTPIKSADEFVFCREHIDMFGKLEHNTISFNGGEVVGNELIDSDIKGELAETNHVVATPTIQDQLDAQAEMIEMLMLGGF